MRIDCEQCGAAFSIDDALITDRGVRAQCPKCGHQKIVKKPAGANPFAASPGPVGGMGLGGGMGATQSPFTPSPPNTPSPPSVGASLNPFGAEPSPAVNPFAPPPTGAANPFAAPSFTAPTGPSGGGGGGGAGGVGINPFAATAGVAGGAPFGGTGPSPVTMSGAVGPGAPSPGTSPFGRPDGLLGAATPPPLTGAGAFPSSAAQASSPQPVGNPFQAPLGDPFGGGAPSAPSADPFGAGASPATDPFARLAQAPARAAMGAPPGPPAPTADPFGGGAADVDDPFAKLDLGGPAPPEQPPAPAGRWRVKTRGGMDAEVELAQLRELLRGGQVGVNDEAAPLGQPLKPIHSQALLAVTVTPKPGAARVAGARARAAPSFGRMAGAIAVVVGLVVVGGGVALFAPELFEKTTDAGVNPLRRARSTWEKQFPDVGGTAQEHIDAGRAHMKLDTAADYRKADEELRQALLVDIGNVAAIAAWVENYTNLPAVRADLEATGLAQEAIAYASRKDPENVDVLRAQGLLKLALNDVDGAQRDLAKAQGAAPQSAETMLAHARSHLDRNPADALALVQQVRGKEPGLKSALVVEGAAQRRLGAFKEARDALGGRLVDDPANTGALKELARLELDVGNPREAIDALSRLLAAEERDVEAHLMRAKIAYQVLGTAEALKQADEYLDAVLKNHESVAGELLLPTLSHAAWVKAELGNLGDAQKLAERARATDGSYAPALFVLGRVYALQKNWPEATKALEQSVRAAQARDQFYEPVARAELARVQALSGDVAAAIRNFDQVIEYDPRYIRAHFGLAATYMSAQPLAAERATQAMTIIRRAFENDPHYEMDRPLLTDYPTARGDLVAFADAFKRAKVDGSRDDNSLVAQKHAAEAMIRYHAGQRGEAEALARKSLAEDRVNLFALLYLGVIELDTGRETDARKRLRLAVDTTGTPHAITRLYLARAEMRTGEIEVARKRLQDLVDQEPTLVQAAFSRAMLLRQEGLPAQGDDELKKVLKSDPDYMPAKRALSESH